MSEKPNTIFEQLRRNSVALISILIAVSSLSYNTWRNEKTEENRNQRFASFEILMKLNELQQVVFLNHYDKDTTDRGNPRIGWSSVLTIRDLSRVLKPPLPDSAEQLLKIWGDNWVGMEENTANVDSIMQGIDDLRMETLELLESLE